MEIRVSPGSPSLYFPVSRPEASGDQTVVPSPTFRRAAETRAPPSRAQTCCIAVAPWLAEPDVIPCDGMRPQDGSGGPL